MPESKRRGMVYVIDDDESIRKALKRLLRSANLDVETFSSAEEFLSNSKQCESACIVMDIRMPGLTGFDLQKRLLLQGMPIPVLVISASDDWQTREQARKLGAVGFFRKPVDDQALLDAIWWATTGVRKKQKEELNTT